MMFVASSETSPLGIMRYVISWVSDASGNVDVQCDDRKAPCICGLIDRIVTVPSPAAAPTDNYDITLVDAWDYDVLEGEGANRDTANTETAWPINDITTGNIDSAGKRRLWLRVRNAGATKAGTIVVYTLPRQA